MGRTLKAKRLPAFAAMLAAALIWAAPAGAALRGDALGAPSDAPTDTDTDSPPPPTDAPPPTDKPSAPVHASVPSDRSRSAPDTRSRSEDRIGRDRGGVDIPVTAVVPLLMWAARSAHGAAKPATFAADTVSGQVVVDLDAATTPAMVAALEQRHDLTEVDNFTSELTGRLVLLEQIRPPDTTASAVAALQADPAVLAAQPNYVFALQADAAAGDGPTQYAAVKLRLTEAHRLATGDSVLVGMVDSAVDETHPELRGVIARRFDAIGGPLRPDGHGTAVAGLIAGHARLTGSAPAAQILAARAFVGDGQTARGSSYFIAKAIDWTAVGGARVINLSFAGPADPELGRALAGAYGRGVTLVAAAGNAGAKSPPLYPAADPHVIAVCATDADDRIADLSNRGRYVEAAAPGVDLLVAAPGHGYALASGTSLSAAEVSGVVALMLQRRPGLSPDAVRAALIAAARPLHAEGAFHPRLVDAYRAVGASQ